MPEACQDTLRQAAPLIRRGGVPQVTCRPLILQIDLRNPFIFANLPCWNPVYNQPKEAQAKIYRDVSFRNAFRETLKKPDIFTGQWERMVVKEVFTPSMKPLEGRTVAEIASERGKDGVDTFLDLALEDDLQIQYLIEMFNANEARMPELIRDPRTMVGLSDGGAHVDMLCDAGYATYLLGTWVREKQAMTLEHAVKRITSEPADYFGIKGRGRLSPGFAADVAIFDYNTVGSSKRGEMRNDLPGSGRRLVMPARGIEYTLVNGEVLYEHGKASGAMPGRVLRSGDL
jgi:N-acyl-D-aspartate/D-glutamate deacylase